MDYETAWRMLSFRIEDELRASKSQLQSFWPDDPRREYYRGVYNALVRLSVELSHLNEYIERTSVSEDE